MADLTPEELEAIVARDMPGWRVRQGTPSADAIPSPRQVQADAVTPDIDTLRRKYLGGAATQAASGDDVAGGVADSVSAASEAYGDEAHEVAGTIQGASDDAGEVLVVVEPEAEPDAYHQGPGPKGVIISSREGRIIGSQG